MFDPEDMSLEEMGDMHKAMDMVIALMASSGSSKFKALKLQNDLHEKLHDIMGSQKFVKNEKISLKVVAVLEQFNSIIDDFVKENDITLEEK